MSNYHLNTLLIVVVIFLISCDEINKTINPTSEYLVDKTVRASSTEQIIESGNDIKIIIPANSLSGDLGLKIKKEGSIPTFSVIDTKLGSNVYRINFTGNTAFNSPIKIIINYDKSQITAGKTAADVVKGFVYANSNWKIGSYVIDEINSKIIFSISNLTSSKINKDLPELQAEGEITFGDAYNTTDIGQNDELLSKMYFFMTTLAFQGIRDDDVLMDLQVDISNLDSATAKKVLWNSNKFTINLKESNQFGYSEFNASGEINKKNWTLMNYKFQYIVYDKYSQMSTHLEEYNVQFNDIKGTDNVYGTYPVWLTFSAIYKGSGSLSDFKNAIKTITYKITNYEIDGTTISNEHNMKSLNWDNSINQINLNLYQVNK